MKKLLTAVIVCLLALGANAQKVIRKDLLGKWELSEMKFQGNYFDIQNNRVFPDPKMIEESGKSVEEIEKNLLYGMNKEMKGNYFLFTKDILEYKFLSEHPNTTPWELLERDGNQILKTTLHEYTIYLKDGKLYIDDSTKQEKRVIILRKV